MRAIGYVRVSTEEQASSGLGLEAQRAAIAAAAKRLSLDIITVHADEGVSGSLEPRRRPGLSAAIAELGAGDVLLVAKRDRVARVGIDIQVLERDLLELDVRIVSAAGEGTENDEPSSRLMRWILDGFAQYELDVIRDRTKKALRAARDRGGRAGAIPFGYRLEGELLVEESEEQLAVARILLLRSSGKGFKAIAKALGEEGFRPRGIAWRASSIRSILETGRRRGGTTGRS